MERLGIHYTHGGFQTFCLFSPNEVFYKVKYINTDCYELDNPIAIINYENNKLSFYPNPTNKLVNFSEKVIKSNIVLYT
jgi:hypothetical protein